MLNIEIYHMRGEQFLCFPFIVALGFILFAVSLEQGHKIIRDWARENNCDLIDSNYSWFNFGPFFFRASKSQMVYTITVRDLGTGSIRYGWARCGNWFWGVLGSDEIKVILDGEPFTSKKKNELKRK